MKQTNVYISKDGNFQMQDSGAEKLLKMAKIGDTDAFGALYTLHFEKVYRYLYYRTSHKETAEDLSEEVFTKAYQKLSSFEGDSKGFQGWVMVIARNLLVDFYRRQNPTVSVEELDFLPGNERSPVDALSASDDEKQLLAALGTLPKEQQEVVQLRFIEGYEISDIAKLLNKSEGNIRIIQYRAIKKLREILSKS